MKKFLSVFLSLAVAAAACLGLSACGDKNKGDDSVGTRAEWIAAFAATKAQAGYTYKCEQTGGYDYGGLVVTYTSSKEVQYNAGDMISISKEAYSSDIAGAKQSEERQTIYSVDGDNRLYLYEQKDVAGERVWSADMITDFVSNKKAAEYFALNGSCNPVLGIFGEFALKYEEIEYAFDAFSYDEKTHIYSYVVSAPSGTDESDAIVEVSFRNGLVNHISRESAVFGISTRSEYRFTYKIPKLSVPSDAKKAAQ